MTYNQDLDGDKSAVIEVSISTGMGALIYAVKNIRKLSESEDDRSSYDFSAVDAVLNYFGIVRDLAEEKIR